MSQKFQSAKGVDYETVKKAGLNYEPMQMKVSLSELEFDKNDQMSIRGIPVRSDDGVVTKQIYNALLKINPSLSKMLGSEKGIKNSLVSIIKGGLSQGDVKKSQITVVGNPVLQTITNILKGERDFITNKVAFEMFEKTMNSQPDLTLVGASIGSNGSIEMNVRKDIVLQPKIKAKAIVGEEFNPGYTFKNNAMTGIQVGHYAERLVCLNGMTVKSGKGSFTFNKLSSGEIKKFSENFLNLSKDNFAYGSMPEIIAKASSTAASFHEVLVSKNIMQRHSKLTEIGVNQFLPEFGAISRNLATKGVDYAKCSDMQLKNYPTPYNVWEIVNRLTWFGSHETGLETNFGSIQNSAGTLFSKPIFDTENLLLV